MSKITYEIVEHDGGWAYRVGGVFSEAFPSHDLARKAAETYHDRRYHLRTCHRSWNRLA